MFDWNDLRHFLAVARTGTTSGAARVLGVSQPTVVRRVATLESMTGTTLFTRRASGYSLTDHGRAILAYCERAEVEMCAVSDRFAALSNLPLARIRLAAPESVLNSCVLPALTTFRTRFPDVDVQLIIDETMRSVQRGDADVSWHADLPDPPMGVMTRRLPYSPWGIYGSRAYLRQMGEVPAAAEALHAFALIGTVGRLEYLPAMRWLHQVAPDAITPWRANGMVALTSAVRAGIGLAPLPIHVGANDPQLQLCFPVPKGLDLATYLVARHELRNDAGVLAMLDVLVEHQEAVLRDALATLTVPLQPA